MLVCRNFNLFDLAWWKLTRSSSTWDSGLRIFERVFNFERTRYLVFFKGQILRWITVMLCLFWASSSFKSKNFDLISLFYRRSFCGLWSISRSYRFLRYMALFRRFCGLYCKSGPISCLIYFFWLSSFNWTFHTRCNLWNLLPCLVLKIHLELLLMLLEIRLLLNDSGCCVTTRRIWNGSRTFCEHVRTCGDRCARTVTLVILWRVTKLSTGVHRWRNTCPVRIDSRHSLLFDSCLTDHPWSFCLLVLLICRL